MFIVVFVLLDTGVIDVSVAWVTKRIVNLAFKNLGLVTKQTSDFEWPNIADKISTMNFIY